jgi:hypothetical protein
MITLSDCLGNARVFLGNTRALLHAVAAKLFFILTVHDPQSAMGRMPATEPSLDGEAGCRGTRVSVEPSETGRRGPVLKNA